LIPITGSRIAAAGCARVRALIASVKELYPDLFDDWSKRYERTDKDPNAAADAYLRQARGLNAVRLKGAYTQEHYQDKTRNIGSATIRFPITADCWWERIIDRPARFGDKKASFSYGSSYRGHWWTHPDFPVVKLAEADDIWLTEGIFDSCAFVETGIASAALMSTNNYPETALKALAVAVAEAGLKRKPRLVFAFDVGKAGVDFTRRYVERAISDGWDATAAQVRPDGDGIKLDWNDLFQRDRLTEADRADYLWAGDVTLATDAKAKAWLLRTRPEREGRANFKPNSFPLILDNKTYWARFTKDSESGLENCTVNRIANCAFRILYRERDDVIDETNYYLSIRFPGKAPTAKGRFASSALMGSADFKKRLFAWGAMWTGTADQLDRIVEVQSTDLKTVTPIDFTGYSRDHKAWILGDIAVHGGKVIKRNAEDYFDIGKKAVKLRTAERLFEIDSPEDAHDFGWVRPFVTAFQTKGLLTLGFWTLSLFAEQVRDLTKALGFLEMCGPPGTGKSTILIFLWQLCGRTNYEGFDPAKATPAAVGRNFAAVGNFPVVLMEGDRSQDIPHSKRFDFDELKPLWQGRGLRERGIRNSGNETYSPPFRAAVLIEQNDPVNGSPALLTRLMQIVFDNAHFSEATKTAVNTIENWPIEKASNFLPYVLRREKKLLDILVARFPVHLKAIGARGEVHSERILKNHAQLAASIDMLRTLIPISDAEADAAVEAVYQMAGAREAATSADHPVVTSFWEKFDWIEVNETDATPIPINHHRDANLIAINLNHFEERCRTRGLQLPDMDSVKKHLRTSKSRPFVASKPVNSVTGKAVHCWVFQRPLTAKQII
jgi:Toprim-like